jgi:hypothetical protein
MISWKWEKESGDFRDKIILLDGFSGTVNFREN